MGLREAREQHLLNATGCFRGAVALKRSSPGTPTSVTVGEIWIYLLTETQFNKGLTIPVNSAPGLRPAASELPFSNPKGEKAPF